VKRSKAGKRERVYWVNENPAFVIPETAQSIAATTAPRYG